MNYVTQNNDNLNNNNNATSINNNRNNVTTANNKVVVFDLDETLGYFVEFSLIWNYLNAYLINICKYEPTQQDFNETFDLYPEFMRPNILTALQYLKIKKQSQKCSKIMIYTNNKGPDTWPEYIARYFEYKLKFKMFDRIVGAFKINGKSVDTGYGRKSKHKTHEDLLQCTQLSANTQMCFLDDTYHPEMCHDNIYYINLKPYVYKLPFETLVDRFVQSNVAVNQRINAHANQFKTNALNQLNKYDYVVTAKNLNEYELDKIITKKIMWHLNKFFKQNNAMSHKRTSKNSHGLKNKTIRQR
jgi:hypothetical protein